MQGEFATLKAPKKFLKISDGMREATLNMGAEDWYKYERDCILYSTAFRRMSAKTQVFNSGISDHLRTRLTHTLEVSQIARNISEALGLDVNLTEGIALGHDIGHTPFGHVGERTLHKFSCGDDEKYRDMNRKSVEVPERLKGFKHNLQSIRILTEYTPGCSFSNYLLYGVGAHSKRRYPKRIKEENRSVPFYDRYDEICGFTGEDGNILPAWSFEALVVKWADEIAQRHHDMEDAYFQKIMTLEQIVSEMDVLKPLCDDGQKAQFENLNKNIEKVRSHRVSNKEILHEMTDLIVGIYTKCSIREFSDKLRTFMMNHNIVCEGDFENVYPAISESEAGQVMDLERTPIGIADKKIGEKLKFAILDSYAVQRMDGRCEYIVRRMVRAYRSNPQQLPDWCINRFFAQELRQELSDDDYQKIRSYILEKMQKDLNGGEENWENYEYRNALWTIRTPDLDHIVLPVILRVVFDYISTMTDHMANEEYRHLYE